MQKQQDKLNAEAKKAAERGVDKSEEVAASGGDKANAQGLGLARANLLDAKSVTNLSAEIIAILMTLNMDIESLMVAFLYPAFESKALDLDEVEAKFGLNIRKLLLKVKDMEAIRFLQNLNSSKGTEAQVDRVRRMLLSMVDDVRAVVIKLAERIAVIRAAKYADDETKLAIAREIANIYAPLANRLGIGQLKWELEDLAFRFLHNDYYMEIARDLGEKRVERERYIENFVAELRSLLEQNGIHNAEVYGRPKHIYSIWRKMQRKHLPFSELYDVRAVRVIVDKIEDCYAALSIVHSRWSHIEKEFDDYIANPKPNGYQSIHTVVYGDGNKVVEIQFRTKDMHQMAELGVAAHWKYKEGGGLGSGVEQRINWLRKLLAWRDDMVESGALLDEFRKQVFEDRVYVFTPRGEVVDLPTGATPLDFAYQVHTMVGHRCIGAKVDGRIVPYTYKLKTGEQVEIITQKEPNPSRDWINADNGYLKTSRARAKVINWFRKVDYDKNLAAGDDLLEREVARHGLGLNKDQVASFLKEKLARFNVKTVNDIYAGIGAGDIKVNQIISFLEERVFKRDSNTKELELQSLISEKTNQQLLSRHASQKGKIVVDGVGNVMTHIAKCCQPIPGDDIIGFITQGRGISIHKSNCSQLKSLIKKNPERVVTAQWGDDANANGFTVTIKVVASDYPGLLRDVTTVIANEKINVLGVRSHTDRLKDLSIIDIDLMIVNLPALTRVLSKLNEIKQVRSAARV
ncbi:MAG TPA: GTP diphosphokinase [Candidatus Anaerobiospirillum stercoravium]|nr:GTP diphosphokinase [Candidatus Anaerobiospirillum stercoravium]